MARGGGLLTGCSASRACCPARRGVPGDSARGPGARLPSDPFGPGTGVALRVAEPAGSAALQLRGPCRDFGTSHPSARKGKLRPEAGSASGLLPASCAPRATAPAPKYSPAREWAARGAATPWGLWAGSKVVREQQNPAKSGIAAAAAEQTALAAEEPASAALGTRGRGRGGAFGRPPLQTRSPGCGASSAC